MNRADTLGDALEPAVNAPDPIVNPGRSVQGNDGVIQVLGDFAREALEEQAR